MDQADTPLTTLASASKRVAQRSLDIGANRLELLIVEVQEERERLLHAIQLALGAAAFALLAGIALTLGIVLLLWERSPLAALIALTALYSAVAFLFHTRLTRLQHNWQMFPATLDQLRKDCEWLSHRLQ
jgi:uncharacterized membrane protein YqjE